jgi:sugar phosphate isomerase/epimerase
MILSCLPVSYFNRITGGGMTVGDWAREGRRVGLDAVDISVLFVEEKDPGELAGMRRDVEDAGMSVACATTYPDFTYPDPARRSAELAEFIRMLPVLAAVGAKMVRITAGQAHPETKRQAGLGWALEGITGAVDAAGKAGIQLVFENHAKPGVWRYADFAFPSDIFLEIARELRGTPVRILFDTANPLAYGDDPRRLLEKVIAEVIAVHASDTAVAGKLEPVVVGRGLVPYADLFGMLRQAGFDGLISIEEASNTGKAGVKEAAAFVRRAWESAAT